MKYNKSRGTHDILPDEMVLHRWLELQAGDLFQRWGYQEIATPLFEDTALFTRSIGETTDIVEKEMYSFQDKAGRDITLRPEGTAPVVRAVIENSLLVSGGILKLFYSGPMYRYERPQSGRYREFYQIGVESFGSSSEYMDFEVISLAVTLLQEIKLNFYQLHLNSLGCNECRTGYRTALIEYFSGQKQVLCADCQRRMEINPFRVLDCKLDSEKLVNIPDAEKYLCSTCKTHFIGLQKLLTQNKIDYKIDSYLVRGLDYYTRTIFEIKCSGLGAQDTILAGGRYDNLVKELGGADTPAVGFALGIERVISLLDKEKVALSVNKPVILYFAAIGDSARDKAIEIVSQLRKTVVVYTGFYDSRSLKSQLREADKINAQYVLILGDNELVKSTIILRDLKTQEQKEVSLDNLVALVKELVAK